MQFEHWKALNFWNLKKIVFSGFWFHDNISQPRERLSTEIQLQCISLKVNLSSQVFSLNSLYALQIEAETSKTSSQAACF